MTPLLPAYYSQVQPRRRDDAEQLKGKPLLFIKGDTLFLGNICYLASYIVWGIEHLYQKDQIS